MTTLGLRPSGRLGPRPTRPRPLASPLFPDQLRKLAFWYKAADPQNGMVSGAVQQAFGLSADGRRAPRSGQTQANPLTTASRVSTLADNEYVAFERPAAIGERRDVRGATADASSSVALGTPAAIVRCVREDAGPFNHAEVGAGAVVGATQMLSAVDQQNLIDRAGAKSGF
jgi:hypothetical protein